MGNSVHIQSCIFTDTVGPVKDHYADGELVVSYGFRIFDDEGKDYCNQFAKGPWQELREKGAEEILKFFIEFGGSEGTAIAEFALWTKGWVYFDGEYVKLSSMEEEEAKDEEEIN